MENLPEKAREVRKLALQMIYESGVGHPAGSLSSADILTYLYSVELRKKSDDPSWEDRDRFVLSAGHLCPALYSILSIEGYFPKEELNTHAKLGTRLQGHPERVRLPGIETSSGSLGMGLGQASGIALAGKMDGKDYRVYCLCSDGEHNEGSHWEAVMFAAKKHLSNLVLVIDRNKIQIDGTTEEVNPLGELAQKYKEFGWNTLEIDGHNFEEMEKAFVEAKEEKHKPTVIVADTIAGRGVSFMNNPLWHAKVPTKEEYDSAMEELNA